MKNTAKTTTCDIDKEYFDNHSKAVFDMTSWDDWSETPNGKHICSLEERLENIQECLTEWGVSLPDGLTLKDLDEVTDLYYLKGKKIQQKLGMVYPVVFVEGNSDSFGSFFIINR